MKTVLAVALTLALAATASADPIADVRAALGRLPAKEPIRATYEFQHSVDSGGKFGEEKFSGKAVVELEGDAGGFRTVFSRALLDQLAQEQAAKSRNSELKTPTVNTIRELNAVEAAEALDFAPVIGRMMQGAKVLSDGAGTWQGKPVRVLVLRLVDGKEDGPGKVTVLEHKLTLWLGADLVPQAAELQEHMKFSVFLIKGEAKQKRSWHLGRVGDRLVQLRHESSKTASGLGQKQDETVLALLKVHGPA
jgi:hypothetical protein